MRIVTLSGGSGWHVQDLLRAAGVTGHELITCNWKHLVGSVATGGLSGAIARADGVTLDDAEAVLLRTMPPGTLEQIVFRMDLMQRLAAGGVRVLNPPRAIEAAVDKYLALERLRGAGLPVPETIVCQRLIDAQEAFERLGGDVVVKPIFGSEGFGMTRLTDADTAARVFATLERLGSVIYLQRFIDHGGSDLRLFVLGERVLTAMRRRHTHWKTNIAQGAKGEPFTPDAAMSALAIRAAESCGARIAGVDVVLDRAGSPFVLEVNAVPGWRALASVTGVDVAAEVLRYVAQSGTLSLLGRGQGEGQGDLVSAATAAQTDGVKTHAPDPHPSPLPKRERE